MTDFQIKRLPYNLTAHAGLSLVGQYPKRFAQIDQVIDPRFPITGKGGIATISLIKAYIGLLCTGKSDFDTIESLRQDAFFRDALGLVTVPSSPTLRQHMDTLADSRDTALTALDEANQRLLRRAKPTLTPLSTGHLALDFDVFTLNNSGTAKEGVGRTYRGFDGYAPIAGYLAEEGYCLDLELLPSGKFATNDLVLSLAVLAYSILRAIGQATLIRPDSPVRHPTKRRRLRTVMQEIIGIAAQVIQHARRLTLGLGERCAAFAVFERHHQALLQFTG